MEAVDQIWRFVIGKFGQEIGLAILTILGLAVAKYALLLFQSLWCFVTSRQRALGAVARKRSREGVKEGQGVWVTHPIEQPDDYKRNTTASKILAVANLKGGVGKTTLAANIGAYLTSDPAWQKRVLLVDLDYQGSLSSMALADSERWLPPPGQDSTATRAISGDLEPSIFVQCTKATTQEPKLQIATAHYDLAQADNRLLIEWLLKCRRRKSGRISRHLADVAHGQFFRRQDVRYNLADLLQSDAVRDAFDLVIIDCPPRLTTGTIQALCASSHLLIPTILDRPSSEAVLAFCEQVEQLKKANICPHIVLLGIVATKYREQYLVGSQALQRLEDEIKARALNVKMLNKNTYIPQRVALVEEAEQGIAYLVMGNEDGASSIRQAVASLSTHVAVQMGVPRN